MFLAVSLSHAPRIVQVSSSPLFVTRLAIEPMPTLSDGVELKSKTSEPRCRARAAAAGGEDFVVFARHFVFGVFAQVAEFAGGFDGRLAGGQLVLDDVFELFAARLQAPRGYEKPLFLRVGRFRRHERLDAREDLYYAREYRLLRKVFKALVEQKRLGEVARGVGGWSFRACPL